jgi:glyceraldehyde-3-phosphate dehydrogenase/erythrose-4-phosphate dehydrogenase
VKEFRECQFDCHQWIWPHRSQCAAAIAEADRNDTRWHQRLAPVETNAHLLRFDSVHGRFPGQVTVKGDTISVGNAPSR